MAKLTIYKDNITSRNEKFEKLVVKTQEEMKEYVRGRLGNFGKVRTGNGYVYKEGTFPVLLVAHMDTVHKEVPRTLVYANGTLSSTQGIGGDDRCGIYMIFKILQKYDCNVVFLEDEEIGCIGAKKFIESFTCEELKDKGNLKYIIEFDRKGNNHAVTYDCDNEEFDNFVTKEFFKKQYGTCSDISYIAPELGVAAVNLSCGYYKEHDIEEWVNLSEMETVIEEAMKLLERTKELKEPFKYIRKVKSYYGYSHGCYNSYGYDYDWDEDEYYGRYRSYLNSTSDIKKRFEFKYRHNCQTIFTIIYAENEEAAYYNFFKDNPFVCYAEILNVEKK